MPELPRLMQGGSAWENMQDALQNSVVQVVAQIARFNWTEPYKVEDQFEGRGSGFFIDQEGHIITNAHVVDEAATVWVHLPVLGKKAIFTDVIGFCPERDLALLRVRPDDLEFLRSHVGTLTHLPFGDSDLVRRTEQVLVLGYPLGHYIMKSSTGVVSGRESYGGRSLIQITAPINPGNSGGPLINMQGEVIGIAIATVLAAQNIGYAIPINELKIIVDDLYKKPFIRRETLGMQYNYASEELAKLFNCPSPVGVYINKVYKDSLMDKAGIQEGDMLYEFNDFRVDAYGDITVPWSHDKIAITDLVARLKIGEKVTLVIYRGGKRQEIAFTFEYTPPYPVRRMYPDYEDIDYEVIAGMVIMELADNHLPLLIPDMPFLIRYLKPDNKTVSKLIITHIVPGALAQQIHSLMPGFIIAQVNSAKVHTLQELRDELKKSIPTDTLTIKTSGGIFVALPLRGILKDEERLARDFAYPLSPTVKALKEACKV